MARHDPQVNFRIPAELKEQLDQSAKDNNRTLTSELVTRLADSFSGNISDSDISKKLDLIIERLDSKPHDTQSL